MGSQQGKKKRQQPKVDPRNINQLLLECNVEAQAVTGSSLSGRRSDLVPGRQPGFPFLSCCKGRGVKEEEEEGETPRKQAVEVEIPFLWVKGQQLSVRRWRYVNGRLGSLSSQSNSSWVKTSTARNLNMKPLNHPPGTLAHIYTHIIIHATSKQWLPQLPGCLFLFIYGALHILLLFSYSGSAATVLYLGGKKNTPNNKLQ